jgi:pimeloyl-ACP methyl ester carboxylesterase
VQLGRAAFAFVALGCAAIGLASCGAPATPAASTGAGGVSGTSGTAPTTTTSTTLPPTFGIPGTSPLGALGSLGSIQRVLVEPPPLGAIVAAAVAPGAAPAPGERVAFRRFGSGPDLLLIAGEHSTITSWDPQFLTTLAQHFRVTVFDPPGIGYSGPGLAAPSVRSFADAAAGLSNALGLINPVAVGWGLGGGVALSLAERHPGLLAGLVLINSTVGAPHEKITAAAAAILGSAAVTPTMISRLYFPPSDEADRLGWLARISDLSPDSIVSSAVAEEATVEKRAESDSSLVAGLSTLTLPTLVIASSVDAVSSPRAGRSIARAIQHASYDSIPGCGYACFSVDTAAVVGAIKGLVPQPA